MAILVGFYRTTGLAANGLPGSVIGLLSRGPVIPLNFTLQVAGAAPADFDFAPQMCQSENDSIQLVAAVIDQNGAPVNLRNATRRSLVLLKPDGTTKELSASLLTNGLDGAIQYTTKAADIEEAGFYQVQAVYAIGGLTQTTRWGKFRVGENI